MFRPTLIFLAVGLTAGAAAAQTCSWQQSPGAYGRSATQNAAKALEGIALVRHGSVFGLAHDYDERTIPLPFGRSFDVDVAPFDVDASPSQRFNQGLVLGFIGQVGTQFDALGHAGHDLGFYGCTAPADVDAGDDGLLKAYDTASVNPFVTRAVLIDMVRHSSAPKVLLDGAEIIADSHVVSVAEVNEALRSQGVAPPGDGDVVLFRTGWDQVFLADPDRLANSPGPGFEVAHWLADRGVAMVGADTQAIESLTANSSTEFAQDPFALGAELGPMFNGVHFILLTQNGVHLLENMKLGALSAAIAESFRNERDSGGLGFRRGAGSPYEFLFVFAPVPITGLAGSPGQPLAIR